MRGGVSHGENQSTTQIELDGKISNNDKDKNRFEIQYPNDRNAQAGDCEKEHSLGHQSGYRRARVSDVGTGRISLRA